MNFNFHSFLDKKGREAKKQLGILKEVLEKEGFKVQDFLDGDGDNYIYVKGNLPGLSFGGIRIYRIGDSIAYRIQQEAKTYPYGKAYSLKVSDMFEDLVSDSFKEEEAGKKVMQAITTEIKKFFEVSLRAQQDIQNGNVTRQDDLLGRILMTSQGTDYANTLNNSA